MYGLALLLQKIFVHIINAYRVVHHNPLAPPKKGHLAQEGHFFDDVKDIN